MSTTAATLGPSAYWYLTRATGAVALVLLTISVILGVLGTVRFSAPRWPRFAIDRLHRDVSLLVIVLIALHVVTTVLDGFAPITLLDGVIPFVSPYRPLWLGLGTLSFDLLIALVLTSLLRRRLGYRSWRAVHWLAYASWPVAVLHGLGTGTDTKQWWMLLLTAACVAAVLAAVLARLGRTERAPAGIRGVASMLAFAVPLGMAIFAVQGPLQHGWAGRAGTPASLLGAGAASKAARNPAPAHPSVPRHVDPTSQSFTARMSGRVSQSPEPGGAIVQLLMNLTGNVRGELRVRMGGQPLDTGGLSMTGSQVDLSVAGAPQVFAGRIVELQGDHFLARVSDRAGAVLSLSASVSIDQPAETVTGTVSGGPA
ncbi:MAG: ferric reductase-like transmembrane domain-containing protein [Solirubrobacteraceae bacterium]